MSFDKDDSMFFTFAWFVEVGTLCRVMALLLSKKCLACFSVKRMNGVSSSLTGIMGMGQVGE